MINEDYHLSILFVKTVFIVIKLFLGEDELLLSVLSGWKKIYHIAIRILHPILIEQFAKLAEIKSICAIKVQSLH